ncbi:MAG TPA: helicase-associated domain-containing protein [Longimicrobium sp.]|nr:helicase-associated domain-containing protein [Longimicrobium sp.]
MKLHELDWNEVLRELPRWEALSPDARRAFIGIKPGQGVALESMGGAGAEMREAGLLVAPTGRGTLYGLDPALRPLLIALRAADRLCPLAGPGGMLRHGYVEEQLDTFQSYRIAAPARSYYDPRDRRLAAEAASSIAWTRGFLAAETHAEVVNWEQRWMTHERPRLMFPEVAETLRALVQALAGHPAGVPLASVHALVPDAPPAALAAALAAGLRYLLVFVSVGRTANAVVGLLPAVATRLAGGSQPPRPVQARETFSAPFRVGDMTAVLVEAATEPIPVRASDGTLYVRAQRAIGARLASVPGWVQRFAAARTPLAAGPGEGDEDDEASAERVEEAAELAKELRLASVSSRDKVQFSPTPDGRAWLNRGEGERIREVLSALRALGQRNPAGFGYPRRLDFFGAVLPFSVDEGNTDLRAALSAAFLAIPPDALVPLAGFARYHAQQRNPFLGPDGAPTHVRSYWSSEPRTLEGWEAAWGDLLLAFLARRLVPLGCAVLGRTEDGTAAFGLTDAGRYLLGEKDHFELAPEAGGGEVVVQPDFEIVFLAPAPRAEAELGRIAERTGSGVGALFRLTRASVLRAAEQGITSAQLLGMLEGVSRGGVPDNVARQVRDWVKAVRTIRIAPAVLVDCPDAETAGRVRSIGGARVTAITPTLLRLSADAKTRAALVKRLREKGIFVGTGDVPAAADGAGAPQARARHRRK